MYPQIDTLDIIGPQAVLFPQSNTTIDAGMNDNAAGKGFERIERNFETFAELVGYFVPIEFGRNSLSETPRRLDRAIRRGKALPGHQCRHHSSAGRGAGLHGLRSEERPVGKACVRTCRIRGETYH